MRPLTECEGNQSLGPLLFFYRPVILSPGGGVGVARVLVVGHEYSLPGILIDIQLIQRHLARDTEDQVRDNVERDLRPAAS